ncbi:MAG TPA: UDP-N-acetylglucosamine diphosphorylase [Candidatus Caccalectryoclostridium excrementigallinarum]|uniref:UDP-N-acetylglucosamine diphosphorylase n=1 Tax=Candidatus Caccalectryoclostridium excrementigallinarum TaxID=2840710 RepID=A0A9D1MLK4_9FIRM|nr:UDP-N-acetylglucosamine diphosphorylase [Candidatus Caccalectryoclostridium excrementigallinarum]
MSDNIYVDKDAVVEEGAVVFPNNYIGAGSVIKSGAVLRPNNIIENSVVEEGAVVTASVLESAHVGKRAQVGPFCYMRAGAKVGEGCKAGDFVEIKNASLGDGTKASHLAYVGDCDVGAGCNVGCGVIFVNYDGKQKHRSKVGDRAFIGSNSNIIAPVNIGDDAYIAAGTTITEDVPEAALVIGRSRQTVKEGKARGKFKLI